MLLTRTNLERHVCSKDETRYSLTCLEISRDGVVSSDGHRLLITPVDDEAHALEEFGADEHFLLPAEEALRIAKSVTKRPNERFIAALDCMEARQNGHLPITTGAATFAVEKPEGEFPRYESVMPAGEPIATVGFNPKYMAEIMKAMGDKGVKLELFKDCELSPMKLTGTDTVTGKPIVALLMPMRI